MNITALYATIIERLNESGNKDIVEHLDNLVGSAVTGSEGLGLTGKYLFDLRKNNPLVYEGLKPLITEYLKYCNQNGIIIC